MAERGPPGPAQSLIRTHIVPSLSLPWPSKVGLSVESSPDLPLPVHGPTLDLQWQTSTLWTAGSGPISGLVLANDRIPIISDLGLYGPAG